MASTVMLRYMPDGRHAVMAPDGKSVLGLHNSLASAQRQVADYFKPAAGVEAPTPTGVPLGGQKVAPEMAEAYAPQVQQQNVNGYPADHLPTNADIKAGMNFGAALIREHPFANPQQLVAFARQMGHEHASMQQMAQGQQQLQQRLQGQQVQRGAPGAAMNTPIHGSPTPMGSPLGNYGAPSPTASNGPVRRQGAEVPQLPILGPHTARMI